MTATNNESSPRRKQLLRKLAASRNLGRKATLFGRARGGNVAMLFGLLLIPLLGGVGLAIDYGIALSDKTAMQSAADAATLAGAQAASDYLSKNGSGPTQQTEAIRLGNEVSQSMFTANVQLLGGQQSLLPTSTTTISSGTPTVVLAANNDYKPFIAPLFGVESIPIKVGSTATLSPALKYFQIVFLADVSGSMAVGGDPVTIATMESVGSFKCAFACHDPNNLQQVKATDYADQSPSDWFVQQTGPAYCPWGNKSDCKQVLSTVWSDKRALARLYGYKLKIDYVNSAIAAFMSQLKEYSDKNPNYYTVGINTFGSNADGKGNAFNMLFKPSTDITAATLASKTIDVEAVTPVQSTNWGHSRVEVGLTSTLKNLKNVGDGSSATKMQTYVIFLSDGAQDVEGYQIYNRTANANYAATCDTLKKAGVNMFTIWTHYYDIPNDHQYDVLIRPLQSKMPTAMKACASADSQYFEASDGVGISKAVNSVFDRIVKGGDLRLTN